MFIKLPVACAILGYEILSVFLRVRMQQLFLSNTVRPHSQCKKFKMFVYTYMFIYPMKVGKEVSRQWGRSEFSTHSLWPSRLKKCRWRFPRPFAALLTSEPGYRDASIAVPFHKPLGKHRVPERVSTKSWGKKYGLYKHRHWPVEQGYSC